MYTIFFVLLTLTFFFLLVIILPLIIFFIFKAVWRIFPADKNTKWISLGIAVFLFSTVIISFISAGINFTTTIFSNLSTGILITSGKFIECQDFPNCYLIVSVEFLKGLTETFNQAVNKSFLTELPYDRLILFFAVWAAIIMLISWLGREDIATVNNGKPEIQKIQGESRQPIKRENFLFFIVLLVGGYLSIAAIVSIPSLQDTSEIPSEVTDEKLNEQLSSISSQNDNAIKDFRGKLDDLEKSNLIEELKNTLPPCDSVPDGTEERLNCNRDKKAILSQIEDYKSDREDACSKFKVLIDSASQSIQSSKKDALIRYQVSNVNRIGNRERIKHFIDLTYWYEGLANAWQANLSQCNDSIAKSDSDYSIWTETQVIYLSSASSGTGPSENISASQESITSNCELSVRINPIPQRQDLGSQLGIFSFVASWLLRTESLSLVLIVGLIGFGLLGSACSTVIREQGERKPGQPLVKDLTGVVIRGLLAALVCFLAVHGGLVIFASEGDPNPYALLLTCLLAAIYSEPVWDWAQNQIRKQLPDMYI